MQTAKFQCGKCGNQMAVSAELLGKQVRCPHCKQVVQAPASVPAAAPAAVGGATEPLFRVPARRDEEGSIFDEKEDGDDLFDNSPKAKVELPPPPPGSAPPPPAPGMTPAWPNIQTKPNAPVVSEPPTISLPGAVKPYARPNGPMDETLPLTADMAAVAAAEAPPMGDIEPSAARQLAQRRAQQDTMFTSYLLAFLIPYAILITVVALWFFYKSQQTVSPYEILPDPGGRTYKRVDDSRPLPDKLRVALNAPVEVGQIRVTPLKVEQRRVMTRFEKRNWKPEETDNECLVLTLQVENISKDLQFAPNDIYFNRRFVAGPNTASSQKPYTCLEMGKKRFYGGSCDWKSQTDKAGWREKDSLEYVDGDNHDKVLGPGEKMTMLVCTDFKEPEVLQTLETHNGPLMYRVQLRRGVYTDGQREGTVTCIIGVEFQKSDIQRN